MNRDTILLCTGLPPQKVAEVLAEALHAALTIDGDTPIVRRPLDGEWADRATVGGEVYENYLADDAAGRDEQSIFDVGYDTLFEVSVTRTIPGDVRTELQDDEARRIFTEITERLPFPAAHASEGGLLYSAWSPARGRTDFAAGTSAGPSHREVWEPYANPAR